MLVHFLKCYPTLSLCTLIFISLPLAGYLIKHFPKFLFEGSENTATAVCFFFFFFFFSAMKMLKEE